MADNEESKENISHENEPEVPKTAEPDEEKRGNDWELLTASSYTTAPGPREDESVHGGSESAVHGNEEAETSRDLFLSGHFAFPPSQHENLPVVPEKVDLSKGYPEDDFVSEVQGKFEEKGDEKYSIKELDVTKENKGLEFNEPSARHGLEVDDEEQDLGVKNDLAEEFDNVIDPSYIISDAPQSGKEDEADDSELPCGAWWKRGVGSLRAHAKETSTFWSIVVAAAVMGLVVLGQRWQQERWQVLHQRWQLSVGDEKSGRILSRLKDVIVGGSRRDTYVTASSAGH